MQDLYFDMKAPLLSWDVFCGTYNTLMKDAEKYQQSVQQMKQIAKVNLWGKEQLNEALRNIRPGFEEMTGYSAVEAYGRNPKFLQGPSTNKKNTQTIKLQLTNNNASETVLENYRKDGQLYLCKIIIKPVVNIRKQLVNYIAYEQEIAA
jgi:PAS domain S-box-containing protein